MKTPAQVRRELAAGQFNFSRHAFRRAVERNISEYEPDPEEWVDHRVRR